MATNPAAHPLGEWTTMGVQVWEDINDDVGGETPFLAEDGNPGDGYETLIFDQGLGDDPDIAWVRVSPDDPATVDFAFKRSLIPDWVTAILWWTWASQEPLVPADFDYVDTYDEDEVYLIGNSCRWIFDGDPEPVPNICLYEQPTPEPGGATQVRPRRKRRRLLVVLAVNVTAFRGTSWRASVAPGTVDVSAPLRLWRN